MMSALLLGWKRLEKKVVQLDNLKQKSNYLVNCTFNLIDELDHPGIRGVDKDYNSTSLLDTFSQLYETQVVILESPMNDATCALESFVEVPFQVYYATVAFETKYPILIWKTHLINDQDVEHVHYHTIVIDTPNVNQALKDDTPTVNQALKDDGFFDPYDCETLKKFVQSKYDMEYLPSEFLFESKSWLFYMDDRTSCSC
jgi:hypothetical protein